MGKPEHPLLPWFLDLADVTMTPKPIILDVGDTKIHTKIQEKNPNQFWKYNFRIMRITELEHFSNVCSNMFETLALGNLKNSKI